MKNSAYTTAVDNMEKVVDNFVRQNKLLSEDVATLRFNLLTLKMMPYYGGELKGPADAVRTS